VSSDSGASRDPRSQVPGTAVPDELVGLAKKAAQMAYSPYSGHKVGAAVETASGHRFVGCNVENRAYGITLCAEHNAISSAVAALGPDLILSAVAVALAGPGLVTPCGSCRQVILEFGPDALVTYHAVNGYVTEPIQTLIPSAYDADMAASASGSPTRTAP
jgi:cytidine deaminase